MEKKEKTNECSKIFVSWAWLAGIIATCIVAACAIVYAYGGRENKQDYRLEKIEMDIHSFASIRYDIDTIKILLRK